MIATSTAGQPNTPLRTIHVISGDLWAGAEASTFYLLEQLARFNELQLGVILFNEGELERRLRHLSIDVQVFREDHGFPSLLRRTRQYISEHRPDIVHTHRYKESVLTALASLGHRPVRVRTAHGATRPARRTLINRVATVTDTLLSRLQRVQWIAVSRATACQIPALPERIHVIPNGLPDAPRTEPSPEAPSSDEVRIGFVGRLEPEKRPDRFLRLLDRIPARLAGRTVTGVIAGDGSLRTQLIEDVSPRIRSRVSFLGHVAEPDALVRSLDLLVIPSDTEGHPMVLLEAMRSRVPVLASAVGGLPEVLGDACPFLVPPADEDLFARRAIRILASPWTQRVWANRLRGLYEKRYCSTITADQMLRLYRSLLSARRR